jgi:hypothetical protein
MLLGRKHGLMKITILARANMTRLKSVSRVDKLLSATASFVKMLVDRTDGRLHDQAPPGTWTIPPVKAGIGPITAAVI